MEPKKLNIRNQFPFCKMQSVLIKRPQSILHPELCGFGLKILNIY